VLPQAQHDTVVPVEVQQSSMCLKHAMNNVLLGVGSALLADTASMHEATASLQAKAIREASLMGQVGRGRVPVYGDRNGNWLVEVATEWLGIHMPCVRMEHSFSREMNVLDECLGCVVRPRARKNGHYVAFRRTPGQFGGWQSVDSIGPTICATMEDIALRGADNKYFLLHTVHGGCAFFPPIGPPLEGAQADAPEPVVDAQGPCISEGDLAAGDSAAAALDAGGVVTADWDDTTAAVDADESAPHSTPHSLLFLSARPKAGPKLRCSAKQRQQSPFNESA
jgi:hypothetical protein